MSEPTPEQKILDRIDGLSVDDAREAFTRCCGASLWVEAMTIGRPYATWEQLEATSSTAFRTLTDVDWKEAFAHHPQIGDVDALRARFASTRQWANGEQAGTAAASEEALRMLAQGNAAYREKFGYIFIVCATGKSAEEMRCLLHARLLNDPEIEIALAAAEQQKITGLRLRKL